MCKFSLKSNTTTGSVLGGQVKVAKQNHIKFKKGTRVFEDQKISINTLEYNTELFSRKALVRLSYTKLTNLLYKAEIIWFRYPEAYDVDILRKKVKKVLTGKYGEFKHVRRGSSITVRNSIRTECTYTADQTTTDSDKISLDFQDCKKRLTLNYTNKTLENICRTEILALKEEQNNDASKF